MMTSSSKTLHGCGSAVRRTPEGTAVCALPKCQTVDELSSRPPPGLAAPLPGAPPLQGLCKKARLRIDSRPPNVPVPHCASCPRQVTKHLQAGSSNSRRRLRHLPFVLQLPSAVSTYPRHTPSEWTLAIMQAMDVHPSMFWCRAYCSAAGEGKVPLDLPLKWLAPL